MPTLTCGLCTVTTQSTKCVPCVVDGNGEGRGQSNFHGESGQPKPWPDDQEQMNRGKLHRWYVPSPLGDGKSHPGPLRVLPETPKFWPVVRKTSDTFQQTGNLQNTIPKPPGSSKRSLRNCDRLKPLIPALRSHRQADLLSLRSAWST